jgi:hypothetical protein
MLFPFMKMTAPKYFRLIQRLIPVVALHAIISSYPAQTAPLSVSNSDLALILPADRNIRIAASDYAAPLKEALLPQDLLVQVEDAYRSTPVGDAVATENSYADWTLVSARIAPCSPLGVVPNKESHIFCWPEVRLVWQPVLKDFRRYAVILKSFADDRAIHALYDFNPSLALPQPESSKVAALLKKVRTALDNHPTAPRNSLTDDEISEFVRLRDAVSDTLVAKAVGLRSGKFSDSDYSAFKERPEFNTPESATEFIAKLKAFLSSATPRAGLKEMTSFSLPEGREPPQADEWVFLQFLKEGHSMVQQNIKMHSATDGRVLFDFGQAPTGSQMRDDPQLHTALETINPADAAEIRKRVVLSPRELGEKKNIISDRNESLVPNTSCASCHKFNNLRFDFHALSYLEDREISVIPRVQTDVLRDLEWLRNRASR